MPPVRSRLYTLCSALSLLLCAAVCGLWVRSYFAADEVGYTRVSGGTAPPEQVGLISARGSVWVGRSRAGLGVWLGPGGLYWRTYEPWPWPAYEPGKGQPGWLTFRVGQDAVLGAVRWGLYLPHWALCLVAACPAAATALHAWRRRSRAGAGLCPACGYDLRATPDRCPECGAAASPAAR